MWFSSIWMEIPGCLIISILMILFHNFLKDTQGGNLQRQDFHKIKNSLTVSFENYLILILFIGIQCFQQKSFNNLNDSDHSLNFHKQRQNSIPSIVHKNKTSKILNKTYKKRSMKQFEQLKGSYKSLKNVRGLNLIC